MKLFKTVILTLSLIMTSAALADGTKPAPPAEPIPGEPCPPPHHHHGISLQYLGFWFTGPGCFIAAQPPFVPSHIIEIIQKGAVMVETTAGYRLMMPNDPITLTRYASRNRIDDLIASTPYGVEMYPRYQALPGTFVEVFQTPPEAGLCHFSN